MGIIELFVLIVLVVVLGYIALWVIGQLAPGHPPVIDTAVWVIVVLVVLVLLGSALGLTGHDPQVPRLR